jgi:hypothetical protein
MEQYVTVKGIYENGNVHLLEVPDKSLVAHTEVLVLIPLQKGVSKKWPSGIPIGDFAKKINLFAIGGDAVKETEELYHD